MTCYNKHSINNTNYEYKCPIKNNFIGFKLLPLLFIYLFNFIILLKFMYNFIDFLKLYV